MMESKDYYGGVLVDDLENMAKTHIKSALSIAYGEGLLVGINRAKKAMLGASPAQDSEPVGFIKRDFHGNGYAKLVPHIKWKFTPTITDYEPIPLYTHPPADKAELRKQALEEAAKIAEQMPLNCDEEHHAYRFSDDCKAMAWDIAHAIREEMKG